MSDRSAVKIVLGLKAYELLEEKCLNHEDQIIKNIILNADILKNNNEYILIGWMDIKWNTYYRDVKAIEDVLSLLDEIVENNKDTLELYFYKKIQLCENNEICEETNDNEEIYTDMFYMEYKFSI